MPGSGRFGPSSGTFIAIVWEATGIHCIYSRTACQKGPRHES